MKKKASKKVTKKSTKAKKINLQQITKAEYDKMKKQLNLSPAQLKQMEQKAIKEYAKLKKQMESTAKKTEAYIKKNPGKAALVATGIGAALVGAAALLMTGGDKKKKK